MSQRLCAACAESRFDECAERWSGKCRKCGCDLDFSCVSQEHLGSMCSGCTGRPYCACDSEHTGMCADW